MSELTAIEKAWLKKAQRVMNQCPPSLGFYTTGDPALSVYDMEKEDAIHEQMDNGKASDFCVAVFNIDAHKGELQFPCAVHSTAG